MGNKASKPSSHRQKSKSITTKVSAIKSAGIWVIGKNESFELGIGSQKSISLKRIHKNYSIENVYIGSGYNIYSDTPNKNIGISGSNSYQKNFRALSKMSYFNDNNITLQKICVGLNGKTTFYISDNQRIFVNGCNDHFQAGINTKERIEKPIEIREIHGVIDIQSCNYYSIALCDVCSTIILAWKRIISMNIIIPNDIMQLISQYCRTYTKIYITLYDKRESDKKLLATIKKADRKWKEFKRMKGVTVSMIKTGFDHCLLLTSIGTVYSYGGNEFGQCGQMIMNTNANDMSDMKIGKMPLMITYFRQYQKITIKDVSCGAYFSLVLAENGKVFAFGNNEYGQLGNGKRTRKGYNENVSTPLEINALDGCVVKNICCGYFHGYARTNKNEHYLWGSNQFNECLTYDGEDYALKMNVINTMVNKNVKITSVYLGKHNTVFIVKKKNK